MAIHLSSRPDFFTADFQLAHRLRHVLAIYDSIAPEHAIRFPATDQVTRSGAARVMHVQPRYSSRFGHSCPLITEIPDGLPVVTVSLIPCEHRCIAALAVDANAKQLNQDAGESDFPSLAIL